MRKTASGREKATKEGAQGCSAEEGDRPQGMVWSLFHQDHTALIQQSSRSVRKQQDQEHR
jgi:hypothetical protein